ncbi:hypothetical protein LZ518_11770 [Sphingomonas sp. RB56-2]|uniref:Transcriptional regulator n=1 Tax=Sphingomonas brevis TaxID=2908206 RepID=A0ABT0SBL3_9SPHN|nr:hypothetical protein [Sphingomonas brevis]MCL6741805.1 hypothetical protein [Sphingomonas brevis]
MSTEDSEYFRARAIEERARAADCDDQSIANIHLDLAEKYETLATMANGQTTFQLDWEGLSDAQPA